MRDVVKQKKRRQENKIYNMDTNSRNIFESKCINVLLVSKHTIYTIRK